jgi:hypothetical protein
LDNVWRAVSNDNPADFGNKPTTDEAPAPPTAAAGDFATPLAKDEYTDDRKPWEWQSRYPNEARSGITREAWTLGVQLVLLLIFTGLALGLATRSLNVPIGSQLTFNFEFRLVAIFLCGWVGGTAFSIKWLVHAAATGRWHLDRRYWRLLIPLVGGVYACVVLTLIDTGLVGGQSADKSRPIAVSAAFSFLVGYFSDGVSGLLSNVANAVFGTLEKK